MMENVWNVSRPVKALHHAMSIVHKNRKVLLGVAGVASIAAFLFLRSKKDDTPTFEKTLAEMNVIEEQAVQQMSRVPYTDVSKAATLLKDSTLPIWQTFQQQIAGTENLNLDQSLGNKRSLLLEYANLRVQQAELLHAALKENTNGYNAQLEDVYGKINGILDQLQH